MAETSETQFELHVLGNILRPSYLSGFIAVFSTLIVVGSTLLSRLYWSSGWLADTLKTIDASNSHLLRSSNTDGSTPFNTVLLFLFWGCVGLAVYFFLIGLVRALSQAKEIEQEINYVHGDRKALLRDFAGKLITRLMALTLIFAVTALYMKVVLPYAVTVVRTAQFTVRDVLAVVLSVCVLLLAVHLLTILLRILALRPRLFSAEIES